MGHFLHFFSPCRVEYTQTHTHTPTTHVIYIYIYITVCTSHSLPHTSHPTPHTSHLTPHTSHTSHLTPHTSGSHLTPHSTECDVFSSRRWVVLEIWISWGLSGSCMPALPTTTMWSPMATTWPHTWPWVFSTLEDVGEREREGGRKMLVHFFFVSVDRNGDDVNVGMGGNMNIETKRTGVWECMT